MSEVSKILDLYKEGKVEDSTLVKMAAFKDELYKEGSAVKNLAMMALAAPLFGVGAYQAGKYMDQREKANLDTQKEPSYNAMMAMHPALKNEDPIMVRKYFDSLFHFAPSTALEPLAAGAYVRQALEFEDVGGPTQSMVKDLIESQYRYQRGSGMGMAESVQTPLMDSYKAALK